MCFEKLAGSSIVGPSLLIGNLPRAPKHHWQIEIGKNGRKSVNSQNSGFYISPKNSQVLEASKSLSSFGSLEHFPTKSLSFAFVIQLQIFQKVKIKLPKKWSLNFVCIQALFVFEYLSFSNICCFRTILVFFRARSRFEFVFFVFERISH